MKKVNDVELNIITFFVVILLLLIENFFINAVIGILITVYFFIQFFIKLKTEIAVVPLIFLICNLQLVFFPILNIENTVNISRYLSIIIPGILFFYIGVNWKLRKFSVKKIDVQRFYNLKNNLYYTKIFLYIILSCNIIQTIAPNLASNLLNNLINIGQVLALSLFVYNKKFWYFTFSFFVLILLESVKSAVFAPVISLGLLSVLFIPVIFNFSYKQIFILLISCYFTLNIFQNVKTEYRKAVWSGGKRSYDISLFIKALFTPVQDEGMTALERASAGSVISEIYEYVPSNYNFTYGKQLAEDLSNGLIPRFLYNDKKPIDNRGNYMRYTGNYIEEDVSVGINIFGISYAEFGVVGSWIFLFIFGNILRTIFNFLVRKYILKKENMYMFFLIPVIFSNFFKFEEEFVGQFVGFFKMLIICIILVHILPYLGFRFNQRNKNEGVIYR